MLFRSALAWAKAYELTGDTQYRLRSGQIFEYLAENSWDDTACGGGCWWSSSKHYKNSITNQLFFALTTQLASAYDSGSPEHEFYVDWAKKSWAWIGSGGGGSALRRGGSGLFLDGLSSAQCKRSNGNDGGANATWTYNQGVVLSALGKLYEFTRDEELLSTAYSVVQAVIAHLTLPANRTSGSNSGTDRVLIEIGCGDSGCAEGSDHAMFKGAFMRHMGYLRRTKGVPAAHEAVYREFAAANAESAWWHSREGTIRYRRSGVPVVSTLFANDWRGPWQPSVANGEPQSRPEEGELVLGHRAAGALRFARRVGEAPRHQPRGSWRRHLYHRHLPRGADLGDAAGDVWLDAQHERGAARMHRVDAQGHSAGGSGRHGA